MLTPESDTKEVEEDLIASNPEVYESQEFKSAYNTSHSFWDFTEAGAQLLEQKVTYRLSIL